MTFCSRLESCRDSVPNVVEKPSSGPYSPHVPIIEAIIAIQDYSVWSERDVVRNVEGVSALRLGQRPGLFILKSAGCWNGSLAVLDSSCRSVKPCDDNTTHHTLCHAFLYVFTPFPSTIL
ncbi:hypothetical protein GQ43DRAFT_297528 [Delitschia confertaspora ATCC 74209]|uniref:Uncharacterized protein n=1 Tax=Delitschia confertaspora ATCC 74209 TaxID=1513339 RepID=A0A9P4JUM8_9PLEO|nr:hypothetical protein GQ43DRAFT_297528 [Delitschia confertaspora ATCC 74209]